MKTSKPKTKAAAKPRAKREAAGADAATAVAQPAKTRKRQGNVRGLILELLAGGPMPTTELVNKGKFSAAAAFLNLKAMREDGAITSARQGREVFYALTGAAPTPESSASVSAAPTKKRGRPAKAAKGSRAKSAGAKGASSLNDALEILTRRLTPIAGLDEKISVLGRLAGSLPASVAKILAEIRDDLQRLG